MAAKQVYKIPYGLNESYANMNISLQSKDGTVGKVFPARVILLYVASLMICLYLMFNTFIGSMSNIGQKIIFIILWLCLTVLVGTVDTTKRMNLELVPVLFNYLPSSARHIYTRTGRNLTPFFLIVGVESIDEDGTVTFTDGTYGYWYRIVGSASILLFDSDRDRIIDRVDNFFRKWNVESEIVFLTDKEAQKVYNQLNALQNRYDNMRTDDPDLKAVAEEQFNTLKNFVGREFKSIHQYMLIKSDNKEALLQSNNLLQSEYENSQLMIKQCVPLGYDDVVDLMATIYRKGSAKPLAQEEAEAAERKKASAFEK